VNTTNLYSSNPTIKQHVGPLLPIAELLRDLQAALSEARRIQEASRRRLAAQQAGITTKQLELLVEQIACALRVEVERLRSRDRQQHLSFQRQVAMYLPRRISQASFPALAPAFNRDHSTLIAACQVVEGRMARDAAFCRFIEKLEHQITGAASATKAAP
jgi:chromosomal replication initiator protein